MNRDLKSVKSPMIYVWECIGSHTTLVTMLGFDSIRAHNAFPSYCRSLSFACNLHKTCGINLVGRHSDPWTINNETRIIAAHKPIAKLSSRCRMRLEIAQRVALVPRVTNRKWFWHSFASCGSVFDWQSIENCIVNVLFRSRIWPLWNFNSVIHPLIRLWISCVVN